MDGKLNPYISHLAISRCDKKDAQGIPPLKKRNDGVAQSESEKAAEFNGQFTDVFTKSEYSQVLFWIDQPLLRDIVATKK